MWGKDEPYRWEAWGKTSFFVEAKRMETVNMLDLLGSNWEETSNTRRILTVSVFPCCGWLRMT